MSKPLLPPSERKSAILKVRLTYAELAAIAQAAGDKTISEWAREALATCAGNAVS